MEEEKLEIMPALGFFWYLRKKREVRKNKGLNRNLEKSFSQERGQMECLWPMSSLKARKI